MAKSMAPEHVQAYKDATDNLMFLKREQLQVTYYSWLVLAALYILADHASANAVAFLTVGAIMVGSISIYIIWEFQSGMNRFRARLKYIYDEYFDQTERKDLCLDPQRIWPKPLPHATSAVPGNQDINMTSVDRGQ